MSEQLTLNNSGIFKVVVNTKTGKFFKRKWSKERNNFTDYSWTAQIRLAEDFFLSYEDTEIIKALVEKFNLEEGEFLVKSFQLQYVEIK